MASATASMIGSSWMPIKPKKSRKMMHKAVVCRISSDPYRTLRIRPDASESEVKTAFRRLALKYHPDVCKGNNCGVKFQTINEAYDIVINNLRAAVEQYQEPEEMFDEREMGEEWMGSEAGWVPDYAAHMKFSSWHTHLNSM